MSHLLSTLPTLVKDILGPWDDDGGGGEHDEDDQKEPTLWSKISALLHSVSF